MIPCVLDQMFRRIQNLEKRIENMRAEITKEGKEITLADGAPAPEAEKEEKDHEIL